MKVRNLPPLEVGSIYLAADFERFEYLSALPDGQAANLRLHLKNGSIISLPASLDEMQHLAIVLAEAFPKLVYEQVRSRFDEKDG